MSQLRLNPLTGRWVTIVADRAQRPTDFAPRSAQVEAEPDRPCPFCPGNEESTLPALETLDEGGQWRMRVIPNLYPAFDGDEPFAVHHLGPVHVEAEASGIHEVFVYTPRHDGGAHLATDEQAGEVMLLLKRRLQQHAASSNVRYTQAIINHGREAGASLAHPHGQLLGLPFVPGEILEEQRAFSRFDGGCILCATVEAELAAATRVLFATEHVVAISPFWAGTPYELLLVPRDHDLHLTDSSDDVLRGMGVAIRDALLALREVHGDVAYNLVFHTAPHHYNGAYHWHVHLFPKLVTTAGFERGTGVMINIVPPELATEQLRKVSVGA
ncbi:MAG TPA: galactose-1-phosphate uridylyltransferase [Acidimicrobiaceae bacterium]|nr:galactose-1-phosphate uridylyltransferase [Acidimicrobiaceae bacterium]